MQEILDLIRRETDGYHTISLSKQEQIMVGGNQIWLLLCRVLEFTAHSLQAVVKHDDDCKEICCIHQQLEHRDAGKIQ